MPTKKQVTLAEMKVGIFVIIALLLLSALILQKSWGIGWFAEYKKAITYLTDVGGLKPGAPVWLAGIEIGRVRKVTIVPPEIYPENAQIFRRIESIKKQIASLDPKIPHEEQMIEDLQNKIRSLKLDIRIVEVLLDIRPQYLNRISTDSEVSIGSRGLIGDSFIDISPGTYGVPPAKRNDYYVIASVQQPGFREIITGANDVVANFGVLSEQAKNIVEKFNFGRVGSNAATFLEDAQTAIRSVDHAFDSVSVLVDDLHSGEGAVGKLVSDPEMYDRLLDTFENFNTVAKNINEGQGTLAKFINDPSVFHSADETLKKFERLVDRIEKGEGTIGKLSKDAALYEKSKEALERFASLAEKIENGEGTMGKLLKDPALYNNLDQSSAELSKLIYDLRQDPKKYLTIRFRIF